MASKFVATQLAGLLSGDALDVFTAIPVSKASDYSKVRATILNCYYEVNAETYRLRCRGIVCENQMNPTGCFLAT
jgi:hypothetical protein